MIVVCRLDKYEMGWQRTSQQTSTATRKKTNYWRRQCSKYIVNVHRHTTTAITLCIYIDICASMRVCLSLSFSLSRSLSLSLCRLSLNACAEDVSHQALCSERACGCAHQLTNRTSTKIKQTQINKNNSKAELRQRTLSVEWIIGPPNHAHIPFS